MRKFHFAALTASALLVAAPALAQTAAQTPPAAAKATVSDEEVNRFATAVLAVDKVRTDTSVAEADKQKTMVTKLQANGFTPARFNELTQATQADPALQARVQAAVTAANGGGAAQAPTQAPAQ